ncbi:MAG: hypothetical protein LOD90_06510, partial [Symbiobacteriaceae bacterium]
MAVHPPVGLAVARLTELRPAWSHRYHEGRPLEGYCLVSCDPGFSRVTLLVENGRTLTDRSGSGGFYYEGWLVGPAGAVSLGAFNVGPDGRGAASRVIAASQVIGWVTDSVIVPVLSGGEPREGKLAPAVLAIVGVAVWKAAAIVLRRDAAGYLQFKTQQDVRERLIEHQLGLSLSWFARQSMGDLLAIADNDARP